MREELDGVKSCHTSPHHCVLPRIPKRTKLCIYQSLEFRGVVSPLLKEHVYFRSNHGNVFHNFILYNVSFPRTWPMPRRGYIDFKNDPCRLFYLTNSSQELSEGEPSARGAESPTRSAGLTAQLQALRKALYHKYVQEVAALKEQHDRELRTLRDESEPRGGRDSNGELDAGRPAPSGSEGRRFDLERTQERENLEEEVAKVGRLDLRLGFILDNFLIFCEMD